MPERALRRHDLAWLTPAGARKAHGPPFHAQCNQPTPAGTRPAAPCCAGDAQASALLAEWVAAGHPLIVTRQPAGLGPGRLQLGLALPPARGKRRLAYVVAAGAVHHSSPPPALEAAAAALPQSWQALLRRLCGLPAIAAAAPRLFGSAAMQAITGLPCVGDRSDLDVLFSPPDWAAAVDLIHALRACDGSADGPRIDGEIRNALGEAVAWRELASGAERVLVKGPDEVRLIGCAQFAAGFAGGARRAA
jgi:phosphoribosyl-dephospho-CoA transferase